MTRPLRNSCGLRLEIEFDATCMRTEGEFFDLADLADDIHTRYFDGLERPTVAWGRKPRRGPRKELTLGVYYTDSKTIRISPILDRAWIPEFFVAGVLFHEFCHAHVPPIVKNGRYFFHTSQFRALEQTFEHHRRVTEWEAKHIPRLLRA